MTDYIGQATSLANHWKSLAKRHSPELHGEALVHFALYLACLDSVVTAPAGFDRSATLARAGKAAEEPHAL